jgi:hypothetical protein
MSDEVSNLRFELLLCHRLLIFRLVGGERSIASHLSFSVFVLTCGLHFYRN